MKTTRILRGVLPALMIVCMVLGMVRAAYTAAPNAYFIDQTLVSSKRFSANETDFTYQIRVVNQGAALTNASAFVTSRSPNTKIIDNQVTLGSIPTGVTVTSTDTYTLRQNRLYAFDPADLTWTIEGVTANTPPVANAGPDQTARTGVPVTLDGTRSSDADGDPLTYQWTFYSRPSGSAAALSSTTAGRPAFTPDRAGVYVFRLVVNDGKASSAYDEVRVSTTNSAPVANAGPDRTVSRGTLVTLDGSGSSDPDNDTLIYTWSVTEKPAGSAVALSSVSAIRPSFTVDLPGNYRFRLVVSDGSLSSTPDEVVITTTNSLPVADAGADQNGSTTARVTLDGTASRDADNDALAFSWTWISVPAGSKSVLQNADTSRPSFVPDVAGLYVVQLVVNDGYASSVPDTVSFTLTLPVNNAPHANADTATTPQNTPVTINVLANDTDPDVGDTLTLTGFTQPASGGIVSSVSGGLRFAPAANFVGTATFSYTISDGRLSSTAGVTVTVTAVTNNPPHVSAGPDQVIVLPYTSNTATATLAGSVSDDGLPASSVVTQNWTKVSGPGTVSFGSTTATFSTLGAYVLRLTASDGELSASDDVQITVQVPPNGGPVINAIADRTIGAGDSFVLQLIANDPNPGDVLTWALSSAPAGLTVNAQGRISWTPTAAQRGARPVTVRVTDAAGLSDTKTFTLTVVVRNHPPVLEPLSSDTITAGTAYTKTLTGSDPDNDALTYSLVSGPAGMSLTGSTLHWQPTADQIGEHPVVVRLADALGAFTAAQFTVTVGVSAGPVAHDDSYSVVFGQTLTVPAAGVLTNDADGAGRALTAKKKSDPAFGTLSAFAADGSFTYQAPATDPRPAFAVKARVLSPFISPTGNGYRPPRIGDWNRDGYPDLVYDYLNQGHAALSGRDGSVLFNFDRAGFEGCFDWLTHGAQLLLADIDDDGQLEYLMRTQCDSQSHVRLVAVDSTGHTKWISPWAEKNFDELQCAYGNNSCPPAPTHVTYDVLDGTSPAVARLQPNAAPVLLIRKIVDPDAASVYNNDSGTWGYKNYGCRMLTGAPADMGVGCRATLILSATDGSVQQVLTAPYRSHLASAPFGSTSSSGMGPFWTESLPPITADLDGDGQVEIISGSDVYRLQNGRWTLAWQTPAEPNQVAVADLDGDGRPEVIHFIVRENHGVTADEPLPNFSGFLVFDGNGNEIRRIPVVSAWWGSYITVADVDGDGRPELLVMAAGMVHAISSDGQFKWSYRLPPSNAWPAYSDWTYLQSMRNNIEVYDLEGDGVAEVIFQSLGWVHILDGRTGQVKLNFDAGRRFPSTDSTTYETHVLDWDNDGHADIVAYSDAPSTDGNAPTSWVLSGANNDWLPAGKTFALVNQRAGDFDDSGRVLYNAAPGRTFRNPQQLGTIRDSREVGSASFSYVANNGSLDSAPAKVFITLKPQNATPVITSRPPTAYQWTCCEPFVVYRVTATDADPGDTITYSLLSGSYASIDPVSGALTIDYRSIYRDSYGMFIVAATDSHGAQATQTFVLFASDSVAPVNVPNVVGSRLPAADSALIAVGLKSSVLQEQYNPQPVGTVIAQFPLGGNTQPRGSTIELTVSKGPAPVVVPAVVGTFEATASSAFTAAGFSPSIVRQFSTTIPRGVVIAQTPAAGGEAVPGGATLVVSAGSGLEVNLARTVTPANQTLGYTVVARDLEGNVLASPNYTVSVASAGTTAGALPAVNSSRVTPAANSRGEFQLTVNDGTRTASARFVVLQPTNAAGRSQAAVFAQFDEVLGSMDALLQQANAARLSGDTATMHNVMVAWVNAWRTLDVDSIKLATPVAPEGGFPLSANELAARGYAPTTDDVLTKQALQDAARDLQELAEAIADPTTPYSQVRTLFRNFSTRASRLRKLTPSVYGVADAKELYAAVIAHRLPRVMEALVNDVAHTLGMPARASRYPELARAGEAVAVEQRMSSTLADVLETLAVKEVVDQISEAAGYSVRQFYQDAVKGAAVSSAIMGIGRLVKSLADGHDLTVTTGSSLSFNEFLMPYSTMEGIGLNGTTPDVNRVMVIGPDVAAAIEDVAGALKAGGGLASSVPDPKKWQNLDEAFSGLKDFKDKIDQQFEDAVTKKIDGLVRTYQNLYQSPHPLAEVSECVFESGPLCRSIQYRSGFATVYVPKSLSLPSAVAFIVVNTTTGEVAVGTPAFFPHN